MRTAQFSRCILAALFFTCQWLVVVGSAVGQERTVPGPESEKLLPSSSGYLLIAGGGGIKAIQLPSLQETIVRPESKDGDDVPTIHALSGPDEQGRIAYIEDHFFVANEKNQRHLLKTILLDGTHDTALFTRPGNAMWATSAAGHGEIGDEIALSPTKGRAAFVSGTRSVQMPSALLTVGSMEISDIDKKTGVKTNIEALDDGFAWFPDGKRLAYAKLIDAKSAGQAAETDPFGKMFATWDKVPAVFVRDIEAGTESFLHVGARPLVSSDGRVVLVDDYHAQCRLVDVATGKSTPATWPGKWFEIAMLQKDIVLSWCLPTAGTKVKYSENNSPLVGPKEMLSLKLARLNSNEFQTVVPYIDPRMKVSFGQVTNREKK
jgi:hypothetical protein